MSEQVMSFVKSQFLRLPKKYIQDIHANNWKSALIQYIANFQFQSWTAAKEILSE